MAALNNGEKWITSAGRQSDFFILETACKCGCGFNPVHQGLIDILQTIADCVGTPMKLNCVCRCEKHNKAVGGEPNSYHVKGMAADIAVLDVDTGNYMESEKLFNEINFSEVPCIIKYPGHYFCHIDIRPELTRLYKDTKTGEYKRL